MFETILVPVDGSEEGWQALGQAVEVVRREEDAGVLRGLYVVDSTLVFTPYEFLAPEAAQVEETLSKQGQSVLAEFTRRAAAAGVHAETELAEGEPGRVICERAGLADLVVLGRSGSGGAVARLLFGSTFEAVVRHSPRPVMVAVGPARPVRRALLAYDGSDRAKDALAFVAQAAHSRGAAVTVVSVAESGRVEQETLGAAAAYLREHGVEPALLMLPEEHPAAAILRVADEREVDLIALGGYGHGRFMEMLFGHTVDEVLRGTTRPVLVCR
ncbi:MAG: universal stress protein [Chloroflexota bacterium]